MAQVNIKIDDTIKEQSEDFFQSVGLTMSSAITLFLHQVILQHEIPFKITDKTTKPVSKESGFGETGSLGPLDPFLISPSGDPYWSHPENVEALDRLIRQANQGKFISQTMEEFHAMNAEALAGEDGEQTALAGRRLGRL